MKAPGKNFLLVTGILYVIMGGFAILGGLALGVLSEFFGEFAGAFGEAQVGGVAMFLSVFIIIVGAFGLFMGIMGIAYRENLQKAQLLLILMIAYVVADFVGAFITGTLAVNFFLVAGLVLPALYIIGAYKNYKAASAVTDEVQGSDSGQ